MDTACPSGVRKGQRTVESWRENVRGDLGNFLGGMDAGPSHQTILTLSWNGDLSWEPSLF